MFYSEPQKGGSVTWNCGKINSGNLKITHRRYEPKGMEQPNNNNNRKKKSTRHRFSFKLKQSVPERLHALHDLLTSVNIFHKQPLACPCTSVCADGVIQKAVPLA